MQHINTHTTDRADPEALDGKQWLSWTQTQHNTHMNTALISSALECIHDPADSVTSHAASRLVCLKTGAMTSYSHDAS